MGALARLSCISKSFQHGLIAVGCLVGSVGLKSESESETADDPLPRMCHVQKDPPAHDVLRQFPSTIFTLLEPTV
jgi:hypothetical protein